MWRAARRNGWHSQPLTDYNRLMGHPGKSFWHGVREHAIHWLIGGVLLAATGFAPEEWFAHALHEVNISEAALHLWETGVDARIIVVTTGMLIAVIGVLRRRRPFPRLPSSGVVATVGLESQSTPVGFLGTRPAASGASQGHDTAEHAATASTPGIGRQPAATVPGFGARPAIAVLPFRYQGADAAEQEHFVDGVTEDIISALSRWRAFPVIARGSTFTYKGRDPDPLTVGEQLGARYVLEGNIRRQGNRVRAAVSLVDVETTENLLSEQYQFDMEDIFEVQDGIVHTTVGAMEPELLKRERDRAVRTPVQSANAYELFLRGMSHHYQYTGSDNLLAQDFFRRALAISPAYAHASAGLALALVHAANVGWAGEKREEYYSDAMLHARNAVQADQRDPMAHYALGTTYLNTGSPVDAEGCFREAVRLDPSHAAAHANLSHVYNFINRPEEALVEIQLALRLSPHDPRRFQWLPAVAISHYLCARYRQALAAAQEALSAKQDYPVALRYLVATLGQLGRAAEANGVLPLLRRHDGNLEGTEHYIRARFMPEAADKIVDGLRKAGFK